MVGCLISTSVSRTTDVGTTGSLDPARPAAPVGQLGNGGCAGAGDDGVVELFIDEEDPAGGRRRNYTGDLATVVGAAIRNTGQGGCFAEQPLHASRRALANPANAGLMRPDAHLAIVITAAEDNCSVLDAGLFSPDTSVLGPLVSFRCTRQGVVCDQPLDEPGPKTNCRSREDSPWIEPIALTHDWLRDLKPDPSQISVAVIAAATAPFIIEERAPPGGGTPQLALHHSCALTGPNGLEQADPGIRLAEFARSFGGRGAIGSICSADYSPPLREAARVIKHPLGVVCLDTSRLTLTSTDRGLQPACELTEIDSDRETRLLDFEIVPDPAACPETSDHLRLVVRGTSTAPGAYVRARCETPY